MPEFQTRLPCRARKIGGRDDQSPSPRRRNTCVLILIVIDMKVVSDVRNRLLNSYVT